MRTRGALPLLLVQLVLCMVADAASPGTNASGGVVFLDGDGPDGPGIGFAFATQAAMSAGLAIAPPACAVGSLEADDYFYLYGCTLASSDVLALAAIPGYLFASDKSLTLRNGTRDGLLLANVEPLEVRFAAAGPCHAWASVAAASVGCAVAQDACATRASFVVGCKSGLACEGCLLKTFFHWPFTNASFVPEQRSVH